MDITLKLKLLMSMKLIRQVEETIAQKYSENKMRCPTHLCSGQELVPACFGDLLKRQDYVVSTHRAHGHYLSKGGNLNNMIAELYGKETGCSGGFGGSMHLIDLDVNFMGSTAIVGNSIPIGAGLGLSSVLDKKKNITCIYLGDAATEEGIFYEVINICILKKLPIIFVCENNLYSVYSPLKVRQPKNRSIIKMLKGMGIRSKSINNKKIHQTYQIIKNEILNVRKGKGPVFLEFFNYRYREHCGPNYDNNIGYRTKKEFNYWKNKDPIDILQKEILRTDSNLEQEILKIEKKINKQIFKAFSFAEKSIFPNPKNNYKKIFAK